MGRRDRGPGRRTRHRARSSRLRPLGATRRTGREDPGPLATTSRCRALLAAVDRNFVTAERAFQRVARPPSTASPTPLNARARCSAWARSSVRPSNEAPLATRSSRRSRSSRSSADGCGPIRRARELAVDQRSPTADRSPDRHRAPSRRARGRRPEQQGDRGVASHGRQHRRGSPVERLPEARREARRAGSGVGRSSVSAVRHAELVVLGDHDVGRVERARGALGIAQHLVGAERLLERVVRAAAGRRATRRGRG